MADEPWHFDKRIPLALIVTLLAQFALAVWWASQADSRMTAAELANFRQDAQISAVETLSNSQAVSNATLAGQMSGLREAVDDLKTAQRETNDLLRRMMQGDKP